MFWNLRLLIGTLKAPPPPHPKTPTNPDMCVDFGISDFGSFGVLDFGFGEFEVFGFLISGSYWIMDFGFVSFGVWYFGFGEFGVLRFRIF